MHYVILNVTTTSRVKCAVRLTDDDGTHPWLSLNRGLANWGVNPRRWNRPLITLLFTKNI